MNRGRIQLPFALCCHLRNSMDLDSKDKTLKKRAMDMLCKWVAAAGMPQWQVNMLYVCKINSKSLSTNKGEPFVHEKINSLI